MLSVIEKKNLRSTLGGSSESLLLARHHLVNKKRLKIKDKRLKIED